MRVIAGSAKGRHLKSVIGKNTRPTTDKVKEALFSMIQSYLDGGIVLDLYAGTGGLGIEALSRGMTQAIFVDRDKNSIAIVKENIKICGFENLTETYINDANRALKTLGKRGMRFDLIFLDPPYNKENYLELISFISENKLISDNGIIVVEHDVNYCLPDNIENFIIVKHSKYGSIGITILTNEEC